MNIPKDSIPNALQQWENAEDSMIRFHKRMIELLDKKGVKYVIVHDEIIIETTPEMRNALLEEVRATLKDDGPGKGWTK